MRDLPLEIAPSPSVKRGQYHFTLELVNLHLVHEATLKPIAFLHQEALLAISLHENFNGGHLLLKPLQLLLRHPHLQVFRLLYLVQSAPDFLPLPKTFSLLVKLGRHEVGDALFEELVEIEALPDEEVDAGCLTEEAPIRGASPSWSVDKRHENRNLSTKNQPWPNVNVVSSV